MGPHDPSSPAHRTRLADGRALSTDELTPLVYDDLRRLASSYFRREPAGITLQPTALVHEACLQLLGQRNQSWENRAHFMALAATAMRRVLVDAARDRGRLKRGGGRARVTLSEAGGEGPVTVSLIDLDGALERLAGVSERYVRIIELRYFAGLGLEETAQVLGVGRSTIVREWAQARAWLEEALLDEEP